MMYNIYYGTIGKTLGVKYRSTKNFKNEKEALKFTKKLVDSFYFVNEGKFGLLPFKEILKESKITGISIENLYQEHIEDMCRYYVIPTELDTISSKKLRW